jgi:CheY-like chemotaxis protein/HPt (histidine-containing phosphotransfer) domain-containing protein
LLSLVLGRAGAQVKSANNGQIAVELATTDTFDVILMDVEMPVMDGYSAVKELRRQRVAVPVFALTAHAMKGDEQKCIAAGFSGYLTKPINLDQLLTTLAQEVSSKEDHSMASETTDSEVPFENRSVTSAVNGYHSPPTRRGKEAGVVSEAGEQSGEGRSDHDAEPDGQLVSSLPTQDPEFLEIVREFVQRLEERLGVMVTAAQTGDTREIARLAHWLKGSGGMAGFDAFTEPARDLEQLAKQNQIARIPAALAKIQATARRIVIPEGTAAVTADSSGTAG